ncbi:MAG: hypothetical protein LLF76_08140 [Planctomycetaceae bacterium]|nr:hypothetical protein [Planctomycetaceae bacterium]
MKKVVLYMGLAMLLLVAAGASVSVKDLVIKHIHLCQSLDTLQAEYDQCADDYVAYRGRAAFVLGAGKYTGTLVCDANGIDLYDWPPGSADISAATITVASGIDTVNYIRPVTQWYNLLADPNTVSAAGATDLTTWAAFLDDGSADPNDIPKNALQVNINGTVYYVPCFRTL